MNKHQQGEKVTEFLSKLILILQNEPNDIIEWVNGRIEMRDPTRFSRDVISRYFKHARYSSFQRQLNYFGFRKINGKGKMAACTYRNDETDGCKDVMVLKKIKRQSTQAPHRATEHEVMATSRDRRSMAKTIQVTMPTSSRNDEEEEDEISLMAVEDLVDPATDDDFSDVSLELYCESETDEIEIFPPIEELEFPMMTPPDEEREM